jgi:hypothetical protein
MAEQAPDLHGVLDQAKREGWSRLTLDGMLIEIDRVNEQGYRRWGTRDTKVTGSGCTPRSRAATSPLTIAATTSC